jgi:hypothetical protein
LLLKTLIERAPGFAVALAALLLLATVADAVLSRRHPFLEIDPFQLTLRRSALVGQQAYSVAEIAAWAIHSSRLILRLAPNSRVTIGLASLAKPETDRLAAALAERLGPQDEVVGQEFRRDFHRRLRIAIPMALLLPVGIIIWLFASLREPSEVGGEKIPMARRPPAEWPEPVRVEPTPARVFEGSPYVGLWQFSDRMVWIDIAADGSTYQCRVSDNRTWASLGTLYTDYRIQWDRPVWGVDTIAFADENHLVLEGPHGEYAYRRPARLPAPEATKLAADTRERLRTLCADNSVPWKPVTAR